MKSSLVIVTTLTLLLSAGSAFAAHPYSAAYITQAYGNSSFRPTAFDFSSDFAAPLAGFASAASELDSLEPVNGSLALLTQFGDDNTGTFAQEGIGNVGLITQIGNGNVASINQSGGHQHAMILQSGNGNHAFISQR